MSTIELAKVLESIDSIISDIEKQLPAIVLRRDLSKYLGGTIARGTLQNLGDIEGMPKIRVSNKVAFDRQSVLRWYRNHLLKANNIAATDL